MQSEPSLGNPHPDPQLPDRRLMLRRSAAAFVGASALRVGIPAFGTPNTQANAKENAMSSLREPTVGFMLGHEQFPVPKLVELGVAAETAGFDLLATSDHFQPWQANEGHSGEAWVTMGALGQRTRHVWIGPTVNLSYVPLQPRGGRGSIRLALAADARPDLSRTRLRRGAE